MADAREPFDVFFAHYHPRVVRYATTAFGPSEADDIAQETMIRAMRSYERLDPDKDPWPWLTIVARHAAFDDRAARRRVVLGDDALAGAAPIDITDDVEERALVRSALDQLGAADRDVLVLRDCHDVSFPELARLLGRTPNAVRQQVFRARRRLAAAYAGLDDRALGLTTALAVRCGWLRARASRAVEIATALPATQVAAAVVAGAIGVGMTIGAPAARAATGPAARGGATAGPATRTAAPTRLVRRAVAVRGGTTTTRPVARADVSPPHARVEVTYGGRPETPHHTRATASGDGETAGADSAAWRSGTYVTCALLGVGCG